MASQQFYDLETRVFNWAKDRGIFKSATPQSQFTKTLEETVELGTAIAKNDKAEIADAIGDIVVTLIIQANMQGLDTLECLADAVNIIESRTGKMQNGMFVKDK